MEKRKCRNKTKNELYSMATELSFCGHADNKSFEELACRCGEPSKPRFEWTWDPVKTSGKRYYKYIDKESAN